MQRADMTDRPENKERYLLPAAFFRLIFGSSQGHVCLSTLQNKGDWKDHFFEYPRQLKEMHLFVEQNKYQFNVYFCPQLLDSPARKKTNIAVTTCAWADLDACNPKNLLVPPTVALESSPGRFQAFWVYEAPQMPTVSEDLARRIAYYHAKEGADKSGWDLTQMLRVPGTFNFKYSDGATAPEINVVQLVDARYRPADFNVYPTSPGHEHLSLTIPEFVHEDGSSIVARFPKAGSKLAELFYVAADVGDRSQALWVLTNSCLEAGMTPAETFQVARDSKNNKWPDNPERLWNDIVRAVDNQSVKKRASAFFKYDSTEALTTQEEVRAVTSNLSFIERYIIWASSLGDAAAQYHQAGALICLSSLLADSIILPTSFGRLIPNLWFMLLSDSTITRKAQPLDAKILTPQGWTTMGELTVGDEVVGSSGRPTKIVGISPRTEEEVYRVVFNDGSTTECSADHLWSISEPGGSNKTVQSLRWIAKRPLKYASGRWIRQIPTVNTVYHPKNDLPLDPYLLGLLLGDGNLDTSIKFTTADTELVQAVSDAIMPYGLVLKTIQGQRYCYRIGHNKGLQYRNPIDVALRQLGIRFDKGPDKKIPSEYLRSSSEDRLALLQGLMDTDGWTSHSSTNFSSSSKQLALDVQYIVRSLGGWSKYDGGHPTSYKDPKTNKHIECRTAHQVSISMPIGVSPFRLTRKAERLSKRSWRRPRSLRSIESVGRKTVQCIKVAAPDGLYVTDDFIVTHNSTSMNIAMDLVEEIDESVIMATDGSIEGLTTALATRPGKVSIFLRDEFTGLMEQMTKKDYMAGMPEFFTNLYDGRTQIRRLRKEEVRVKNPRLIIYAGGIKKRMQQLLSYEQVTSGFIPRFVFITAVSDITKVRDLGPPTEQDLSERNAIRAELDSIRERYCTQVPVFIGGKPVGMTNKVTEASLSTDAWRRYNAVSKALLQMAMNSGDMKDVLTPTYSRLSFSVLKTSILIAASRSKGEQLVVEEEDIVRATFYGESWRQYAFDVILNLGRSPMEHKIELVERAIHRADRLSRSALMQRYHLTASEANLIFRTLEERGRITITHHGRQQILASALDEIEKDYK